jgi:hypothetical protein
MDYFNQVISIALPNKYTKWYLSICRTAAQRSKSRKEARGKLGYTEAHHILPKSFNLGGRRDPTNLVYLNAKEHFICHRLLMKMFINPDFRAKMSYALWLMVNTRGLRISARRYAQVRESMVGRVLPEGVRLKIKAARAKQVICHSEETKEKMAASNRGQRRSEAARNLAPPFVVRQTPTMGRRSPRRPERRCR